MCICIYIFIYICVCIYICNTQTYTLIYLQCSLAIRLCVKLFGLGASCLESSCSVLGCKQFLVLLARALQRGSTALCEVSWLLVFSLSMFLACASPRALCMPAPACQQAMLVLSSSQLNFPRPLGSSLLLLCCPWLGPSPGLAPTVCLAIQLLACSLNSLDVLVLR